MNLNTSLVSLKNNLKIRMMDVLNDPSIHQTILDLVEKMQQLAKKISDEE